MSRPQDESTGPGQRIKTVFPSDPCVIRYAETIVTPIFDISMYKFLIFHFVDPKVLLSLARETKAQDSSAIADIIPNRITA